MKRFAALALTLLLCLLPACTGLGVPDPTVTAMPASTPSPTTTVTPTPALVPSPTILPTHDAYIPDVVTIDDEPAFNSARDLFEDATYVYTLSPWYFDETGETEEGHNTLYRIRKVDGVADAIAQDVCGLTMSGGKLYYSTGEMAEYKIIFNSVYCFDTATGETSLVFHSKDDIYHIVVYDGRIYYSADPDPKMDREFYSDLFSRNMDGGNRKLVVEEPDSFCIYRNTLYYMSGAYGVDGTPIFQCDLSGRHIRQIVEWAETYYWDFEVCNGKLIYATYSYDNDYDVLILQDLDTGEQTVYPGYSDFALLGQYVVVLGDALDAIDIRTGQIYRLAPYDKAWGEYYTRLYSGDGCVYIRVDDEDGGFTLHRLTIEDGSANIALVAQTGGTR